MSSRLIVDNVIVTYELLHALKERKMGKDGFVALKLDKYNAYNWVEWPFLDALMRKIDLNSRWILLIVACITSIKYSIILNENAPTVSYQGENYVKVILYHYIRFFCALKSISYIHKRPERRFYPWTKG